jgi:thiopeptide-type bacteriocin biosynthesis protein
MPGPDRSYVAADQVVLRAALAPVAGSGTDPRAAADPERLRELIETFRRDPALTAALELASPSLAQALARPVPERAARRSRMTLALTGYLLRLRQRATPFGLFAGTALIGVDSGVDSGASCGIGTRHRLLLRPAPRWPAGLVAALEADPELPGQAPGVRIAAAPGLRSAGPVHVLVDRAADGPWEARMSVSRSRLLDAVLGLASGGIGYAALLDLLCAAVPGVGRDRLARYVGDLLTAGFLVTDLLPPPGDPDPLGHLGERLAGHPLARRLCGLREDLRHPAIAPADVRRLRGRMTALHPGDAGLVVDALLDTDLRLPRQVAAEVAHAASVAWRCAPPRPDRTLEPLRLALLDRYGLDRPVPLTDLLELTESLGLPNARPPGDIPLCAERDRLLSRLALDALAAGRAELCLDGPVRERLTAISGAGGCPPSVDVFAEVVTASAAALDRGDFLVVLGSQGTPGPAGSTVGRLAGALGAAAPFEADPEEVEVVFRPPDPADADLVGETGWTEHRIGLAQPRRDLAVEDLYIICGRDRLRLHSKRLGRDIRPVVFSTLDPRRADAITRLLTALGRDGLTPWRSWDWGAAGTLPWLPRVRTGRAVLAGARWGLPSDLLHLAQVGTDREWRRGLRRWREANGLPEIVFAGADDRRLPLDLTDPVHADLLRRECRDRGVVAVTEPPGGVAAWRGMGWPRGPDGPHAAEIAVPLRPRAPVSGPSAPPGPVVADQVFLPGGPWLCVNLTTPAALQEAVLAELTDETLTAAVERADVDRWFFVRTADSAGVPRIVVRFHGPAAALHETLLPALHAWGGRLRGEGLIRDFGLASYRPEVWRYGGGDHIEAAEHVFHRDSLHCLDTLASRGQGRAEERAARGALHILTVMLGSRRAVAELRPPRLTAVEREVFARLRPALRSRLAEESDRPPATAYGRGARSAWQHWHAALTAYRSLLIDAARDPAPIAWSLVHMHGNRLAGPSRSVERIAVALARDGAMTLTRNTATG